VDEDKDKLPIVLLLIKSVNKQALSKPLIGLFDSGSSNTYIKRSALPRGCTPTRIPTMKFATLAGNMESSLKVTLDYLSFPEFFKQRFLTEIEAYVFDAPCRYDVIVGRDVLKEIGVELNFKNQSIIWDDCIVAMRVYPRSESNEQVAEPSPAEMLFLDHLEYDIEQCDCGCDETVCSDSGSEMSEVEVNLLNDECLHSDQGNDQAEVMEEENAATLGYKSKTILPSKYEGASVQEVVRKCTHLSQKQQNELAEVLEKYKALFTPKLGRYPHEKIHLELREDAIPHQSKAYTVPKRHEEVFKEELNRLVKIGVLERTGRSEWIAGTFVIPKKDGRVRWISDFRALNAALKRKVYPLPVIGDILKRRTKYQYLTKIDLSLCYYTYELDDESSDLCTIATPFGLYKYKRLAMGISQAPDVAQQIIEEVLDGIEDTEKYIDDIATFGQDWSSHLKTIDTILSRLLENGYTVNPLKCEWGIKESDFLGHWFTPDGVKPWTKKVEAIVAMKEPTNVTEL